MPNLTDQQLALMTKDVVTARMAQNEDGMLAALQPLEDNGDYGDAYLLTARLIRVVIDSLPPRTCPVHGADGDCTPIVGIAITAIDSDTGQPVPVGEDGDMFGSVTPELERSYPDQIGFMRMLAAELNADGEQSVALWHVAVDNDYADRILFHAIDYAAEALRAGKSRLQ
jgi:hypothetical protein